MRRERASGARGVVVGGSERAAGNLEVEDEDVARAAVTSGAADGSPEAIGGRAAAAACAGVRGGVAATRAGIARGQVTSRPARAVGAFPAASAAAAHRACAS